MTPIRQILIVSLMTFLCVGEAFAETLSVSPYKIQKYITTENHSELSPVWRELGIPAELSTVYPRVGIVLDDPAIFDKCEDCRTEIHPLTWKNSKDKLVALKIYQPWGLCRFLIFRPLRDSTTDKLKWQFTGHADHDFARYQPPQHRTERLANGRYFVIKAQGVSGTGASLEYERWYEITPYGMKEVLSLPLRGHECADALSLCRTFSTRIEKNKCGNRHVRVLFRVQYTGNRFLLDGKSFDNILLFTKQKQAVYARSESGADFVLSAPDSTISPNEARAVYHIGALSCEDFIRFNHDDILKIASSPRFRARAWLTRYISGCEPTQAQAKLLQALTP